MSLPYAPITKLALCLLLVVAGHSHGIGQEPPRAGSNIARAVFADGHLWLLSDAGGLSSLTETGKAPAPVGLPEAALDLWMEDGQPAVLTCNRKSCEEWVVRRRSNSGAWSTRLSIATQGEHLRAVASGGAEIIVLTGSRIIER